MRFAALESYLLSKDANARSVQIIVDLLVPKKNLKVFNVCNLDDDQSYDQTSLFLKDDAQLCYTMQSLVYYLSSIWNELNGLQISNTLIEKQKPVVAEIKVSFEDCVYDVKLDDMNNIYILSDFCRMQVYCVAKVLLGFVVYVDKRADYETEHKKEKSIIESVMHDPNSTVEDFSLKVKTFQDLQYHAKFYDWIIIGKPYERFEVTLKPNESLYKKSMSMYSYENKSNLIINLNISIQDVSLLPNK